MEGLLLREQENPPTSETLSNALGDSYLVFEELIKEITGPDFGLVTEWNYYRDGKAWLCKVIFRKKTIFWLSVWDKYFKIVFYFTEKNYKGVFESGISEHIKQDFASSITTSKFIPLEICVQKKEQITDILIIAAYKKSLK